MKLVAILKTRDCKCNIFETIFETPIFQKIIFDRVVRVIFSKRSNVLLKFRIKLISVCGQKFISDILNDSIQIHKARTANPTSNNSKSVSTHQLIISISGNNNFEKFAAGYISTFLWKTREP